MQTNTEGPRTIRQAAIELGLSPFTLYAWCAQRRVEFVRLGRAIRIPAGEIRRLLRDGAVRRIPAEDHNDPLLRRADGTCADAGGKKNRLPAPRA